MTAVWDILCKWAVQRISHWISRYLCKREVMIILFQQPHQQQTSLCAFQREKEPIRIYLSGPSFVFQMQFRKMRASKNIDVLPHQRLKKNDIAKRCRLFILQWCRSCFFTTLFWFFNKSFLFLAPHCVAVASLVGFSHKYHESLETQSILKMKV